MISLDNILTDVLRVDLQLIEIVEHCFFLHVCIPECRQSLQKLILGVVHLLCYGLWKVPDSLFQKLISCIE